jgi:hypothetical protein
VVSRRTPTGELAAGLLVFVSVSTLVSACSSGGPTSASSPGGPTSASCKVDWADLNMDTKVFPTQSAANSWANQYDPNSNVAPVYKFTVTANQTMNVAGVTVIFYNGSGTKINSTATSVNRTLTSGQSYASDPTSQSSDAPDGAASCKVVKVTMATDAR